MLRAPEAFSGNLLQLYEKHIQFMLPKPAVVSRFHEWMCQYADDLEAVFPIRFVRGLERRKTYQTVDGTYIAPADNSPAWVAHALLMEERLRSYQEFRDLMMRIPVHMFDIPKYVRETANRYGCVCRAYRAC